jgi:hypothetical protein
MLSVLTTSDGGNADIAFALSVDDTESQDVYLPESYWLVTDRWLNRSLEGQFHPR